MSTAPAVPAHFEQNSDRQFMCPECENTYSRERAVRRHLTEKHGWPASNKTSRSPSRIELPADDEESVSFKVRAELRELALPLQEKLKTIDRRLVEVSREAADLREAKKQIETTLRSLLGPQAPVVHGAALNGKMSFAKKAAAFEQFLTRLPDDLRAGFTATAISERMKEQGVTPVMSPQVAKKIIDELHDRGVLRLDRVSKGGGNSYVLMSRNGKE